MLMRIIARSTLRHYWAKHSDVESALEAWYQDVSRAVWKTPNDVTRIYPYASIIAGNRIVFNIKGNQYRLIVAVNYATGIVYIRFIGTHREYDDVDAETV